MNKDISTFERYAKSTFVSFLAGFTIVFLNEIDKITLSTITTGALAGIIFACFRGGVKAVFEWLLTVIKP
jgi:hypothetical protein